MSPATASRPRDAAQPIDDFEWPPTADDLSVYELGPDPWQKLQDASSEAFATRRHELSQTRPRQAPTLVRERKPELEPARPPQSSMRKRAGVWVALAIVAAAAGWVVYAAMTRPVPVQTVHHPAPAAATTAPPPITIVATYPAEPDPAAIAPADREPAINGSAATRPGDRRVAGTTPAVFEALAPAGGPAAVDPRADSPDAAIRSLLQRYEEAYDRRDVSAAAALWPSVDETALARVYAALDRQDVHFERCDISASEARGAAVCVGTVRYLSSVEGAVEKEGRIAWTFDLARSGGDWRIAGLSSR